MSKCVNDGDTNAILALLPTAAPGMTATEVWKAFGRWARHTVSHTLRHLVREGLASTNAAHLAPMEARRYWRNGGEEA